MFIIALAVLIVLAVIRLAALTCVRTFPFASGRPAPERDFRHDHGNGAPLVVWSRTLYYYKQPRTRVIIEEFGITVIAAQGIKRAVATHVHHDAPRLAALVRNPARNE
jgi:hypothetical protein